MKLILEKGQRLFFVSDTHFGHHNLCAATTNWTAAEDMTRDFKSLDSMNDTIVNNINHLVDENDILFHLGDWSFGGFENIQKFRDRIFCKNIHLVLGNHDQHITTNKDGVQSLFSSVNHYVFLDLRVPISKNHNNKYSFVLSHYPIASWERMNTGVFHCHGHTHLPAHLRIAAGKAMDIGMDGNGLEPIEYPEVVNMLRDRPIRKLSLPDSHHEKRLI